MASSTTTTSTSMTTTTTVMDSACNLWCLDQSAVSALLASSLQNIGALHHRSGRLDDALRTYGEAVKVWIDASTLLAAQIAEQEELEHDGSGELERSYRYPMMYDAEGREAAVSRLVDSRMLEARLRASDEALEAKRSNDEQQQGGGADNANGDGSRPLQVDLRRSSILVGEPSSTEHACDARCSIATALYNMGLVYHETCHWEEARSMYESALDTLADCIADASSRPLLVQVRRRMNEVDGHRARMQAAQFAEEAARKEASRSASEGNPAAAAA